MNKDNNNRQIDSSLGHQLRHQLAAIAGSANRLRLERARMSNAQIDFRLTDIERWATGSLFLIERDRFMEYEKQDLDLHKFRLIGDLLMKLLHLQIHWIENTVKIVDFKRPPEDLVISMDYHALRMVIQSILNNAIDYSFRCTPIMIKAYQENCEARIIFTNFGLGIEQADLDNQNIYKRNWRAWEARLFSEVGTGIGLAVVDHLVNHLGLGSILATSERVNERNCFLLYFAQKGLEREADWLKAFSLSKDEISLIQNTMTEEQVERLLNIFQAELKRRFYSWRRKDWEHYINSYPLYKTSFLLEINNLA